MVMRSAALKGRIVGEDERESDLRMILNFGHTIGHSLEAATEYEQYLHGEAVAVGMMGAALISQKVAGLPHQQVERLAGSSEEISASHFPARNKRRSTHSGDGPGQKSER